MASVSDGLQSIVGDPQSLLFSILVFAVVFGAVAAVGWHLLKPPKTVGEGPAAKSGRGFMAPPAPTANDLAPAERPRDPLGEVKRTLHIAARVVAIIIVASMVVLTVASYFATDPSDGSRLLTIVLAAATLIVAGHLHSLDRRHRPAPGGRDEVAPRRDLRAQLAAKVGERLLGRAKFEWTIAPTQVETIDLDALERARAMAAEGRKMDEICRTISAEYDQWSPPHQQAYQSVVRAAIEHKG